MKTVWKFQLTVASYQRIEVPVGGEILTVQCQEGSPCLWILVDPKMAKEFVHVMIYGTGHEIPSWYVKANYIGTFQLSEGKLVFHVLATREREGR